MLLQSGHVVDVCHTTRKIPKAAPKAAFGARFLKAAFGAAFGILRVFRCKI